MALIEKIARHNSMMLLIYCPQISSASCFRNQALSLIELFV
jgi:hypothetical protein